MLSLMKSIKDRFCALCLKKEAESRIHQQRLLLITLCLLFSLMISTLFVKEAVLRSIISIACFWMPYHGLKKLLAARRLSLVRQQYAKFIQDLSVNMSDGLSFERSLLASGQAFIRFYRKNDLTSQKIHEANRLIQAQVPLTQILYSYQEAFPCPEAQSLFVSLKQSLLLGEQTLKLLRAGSRMTSELNIVLREAQQMNRRQNIEALILAIMPPAMVLLLSTGTPGFFTPAYESSSGIVLLSIAYVLSMLSTSLALSSAVLAQPSESAKEKPDKEIRLVKWVNGSSWCRSFGELYQRILPRSYREALDHALISLHSSLAATEQRSMYSRQLTIESVHYLWKLPLLTLMLPLAVALTSVPQIGLLGLLLAPLILVVHDLSRMQDSKERMDQWKRDFPLFLNQVIVLMESGLVPLRALRTLATEGSQSSVIADELIILFRDLQTGEDLARSLNALANRISVPDIQQALNALAAYTLGGSGESMAVLRIQGQQCWQLARQSTQKDSERIAARMMLPMVFDLLAIILICIAPVVINFQSF